MLRTSVSLPYVVRFPCRRFAAAAETALTVTSPGRKSSVLRTPDFRPYVVFFPPGLRPSGKNTHGKMTKTAIEDMVK